MSSGNYFTVEEDYGSKSITDITTLDYFPLQNWWRNNPLKSQSMIRPNLAGYYPPKKYTVESPSYIKPEWEYAIMPVCSTIFPQNPQFQKDRQIILYR
jgi:hypothetical protein